MNIVKVLIKNDHEITYESGTASVLALAPRSIQIATI
jgi:hypothetical protein